MLVPRHLEETLRKVTEADIVSHQPNAGALAGDPSLSVSNNYSIKLYCFSARRNYVDFRMRGLLDCHAWTSGLWEESITHVPLYVSALYVLPRVLAHYLTTPLFACLLCFSPFFSCEKTTSLYINYVSIGGWKNVIPSSALAGGHPLEIKIRKFLLIQQLFLPSSQKIFKTLTFGYIAEIKGRR